MYQSDQEEAIHLIHEAMPNISPTSNIPHGAATPVHILQLQVDSVFVDRKLLPIMIDPAVFRELRRLVEAPCTYRQYYASD